MFATAPYIELLDDWVCVWIGDLTEPEVDAYVRETRSPDPEGPNSEFSRELGSWYDHHQLWGGAVAHPLPIAELAETVGVQPPRVVSEIGRRGGSTTNARCVLVLFRAKVASDDRRAFAGGRLRLLGCWQESSPVDY